MPPVASGSGAAAGLGQVIGRLPRRRPIATISVLALTVVPTVLQFPFPAVRLALWRDPDALAAGQWWRLVTALFVQNDRWWQIVIVLACIAGIGVLAERLFGPPGGHLRHRGPSGPVGDAGWPLQRAGLDRGGPEPAAWVGPRLLPTQQAQGRVGHTGLRGAHHDREPPGSPSNATGARLARAAATGAAVALGIEITLITAQAARGVPSHFNTQTAAGASGAHPTSIASAPAPGRQRAAHPVERRSRRRR
jgi:hypothetical protein